ncbi:tetratricopeptide repeat protein [Caballeronia sp. HLA56]
MFETPIQPMPSDTNRYHEAAAFYSNGRYAEALETLAPLVLDADALNLAAVCAYRLERHDEAERYWLRAIDARPDDAGMRNNLANLFNELQRYREAETLYRNALEILPDYPVAHYNLANVLDRQGRADEAEEGYRRALALKPDFAEAHANLAALLARTNRLPEAEAEYRHAIDAQPAFAEARNNLGNVLRTLGKLGEARAQFEHVLAARPDWADAHLNFGNVLKDAGLVVDAEHAYRRAVGLRPDYAAAYTNLGIVLGEQGRLAEAEVAYRHVVDLAPQDADAHFNLADAIYDVSAHGRFDRLHEAQAAYEKALAIRPDFIAAHLHLGNVYREDETRLAEAEATFRHVLSIDPECVDAQMNLATLLLGTGRYEQGWPLFEARCDERFAQRGALPPALPGPRWQGEALTGKTLIVMAEQGFGDTIQFSRYLPELKVRGLDRLTVVCPPALVALIGAMDCVDACIAPADLHALPAHDYSCFLMSLPFLMGTTLATIPSTVPYLRAPREKVEFWRARLPAGTLKAGIAWTGEPRPGLRDAFAAFSRRWLAARQCERLLTLPGVHFVSLQKGATARAECAALPDAWRLSDPMNEVADFADTAALIESLDLVMSVDTSVAHLAGALGKPLWIPLCSNACWRWLAGRDDSPWYPTARLFRQQAPGDWDDVIERVADALTVWQRDTQLRG